MTLTKNANGLSAYVQIPTFGEAQGLLGVLESGSTVPFEIKRLYFIHSVPIGVERGGHGHKELQQLFVALAGSFKINLTDGKVSESHELDDPSKGLVIKSGLWRDILDFSSDAVCLVVASEKYDEQDYLRNFEDFLEWKKSQ